MRSSHLGQRARRRVGLVAQNERPQIRRLLGAPPPKLVHPVEEELPQPEQPSEQHPLAPRALGAPARCRCREGCPELLEVVRHVVAELRRLLSCAREGGVPHDQHGSDLREQRIHLVQPCGQALMDLELDPLLGCKRDERLYHRRLADLPVAENDDVRYLRGIPGTTRWRGCPPGATGMNAALVGLLARGWATGASPSGPEKEAPPVSARARHRPTSPNATA